MLPRPAIVATVRDAADVLDSFIDYHLAIGFAHVFLFFDDPADPFAATLAGRRGVTAIRCDDALRARWTTLSLYQKYRPHLDTEVMARQLLNCELAVQLAAPAGLDWLLHIDSDELFFCEGASAPEHFQALDARGADNAVYLNLEALPEALEIGDYFREVTLFKVNVPLLERRRYDEQELAVIRQKLAQARFNFHLYGNGKAAARVDARLQPFTVHAFARRRPDGTLDHRHEVCGGDAVILHYPNCGFARFLTKYRTLGKFADKWFGVNDVIPFHRQARDVVALGDEARARQFYTERVMVQVAEDTAVLTRLGILKRLTAPAELLARIRAGAS